MLFRTLGCCASVGLVTVLTANIFAQSVLLESAELGATGQTGGTSISLDQYVGWRFQVSEPLEIQRVGGHLLAYPDVPGDLFAALVRLSALDVLPLGLPFAPEEVVATTTFRADFPSSDFLTPFSAKISPGSYALVFGTQQFGATGEGAIHSGVDQPDIPPTGLLSYIFWSVLQPGGQSLWRTGLTSNMRFVVEGMVIDLTADFDGDGEVDGDDLGIWQAAYSVNDLADADDDGDSDGRDFLIWQQQYGLNDGSPLKSDAVPEPSGMALCCLLGLGLSCLQRPSKSRARDGNWVPKQKLFHTNLL